MNPWDQNMYRRTHKVILADFARKLHSCIAQLTFKCLKGYEQQQMNLNSRKGHQTPNSEL